MENLKDKIELNPYGKPKENAWFWFLKEYGLVVLFNPILIGAIITGIIQQNWALLLVSGLIETGVLSACIILGGRHYRECVQRNLIKTFKNSKFISKT